MKFMLEMFSRVCVVEFMQQLGRLDYRRLDGRAFAILNKSVFGLWSPSQGVFFSQFAP